MVLFPRDLMSVCTFCSRLFTVASTPMMQKIPMVMPNSDKKVRSLLAQSSWVAILRLVKRIFNNLTIPQKYNAQDEGEQKLCKRQKNCVSNRNQGGVSAAQSRKYIKRGLKVEIKKSGIKLGIVSCSIFAPN